MKLSVGSVIMILVLIFAQITPVSAAFGERGKYYGESDCNITPNWRCDNEADDFYAQDIDISDMQDTPFEPYYYEPPEPMSDALINAHSDVTLGFDRDGNPVPIIPINNWGDMRAFLNGTLGQNDDHFSLNAPIVITTGTTAGTGQANQFLTTGRPGVFNGVFEGNGNTITGLRLRAARTAAGAPAGDGTIGVGFIQQAGHGAVIRNVNFANAGNADNNRTAHFTAANGRGMGIVIGSTTNSPAGTSTAITIENVNILGHQQMINTTGDSAAGSWGGLVGRVSANTTLNIRDVSVGEASTAGSSLEVFVSGTSFIGSVGGLVGSVGVGNNSGTLNITTRTRTSNFLNVDVRHGDRGATGAPAPAASRTSGGRLVGGVLGFVFSGHASIDNTLVTSTRNPNDTILGLSQVGGIVGGSNARGTLRLNNVENQAWIKVNLSGGNATDGRIGGLVGRAMGALQIINSRNYGVVQAQFNNGIAGGLLGYAGTSAVVLITGSCNGAAPGQTPAGLPLPPSTGAGHIRHGHSGSGATNFLNNTSAATLGGIVGRSRGSITIIDTINYGQVQKAGISGGDRSVRDNTRIGGIIGRVHPVGGQVVRLENVTNAAPVSIGSATATAANSSIGSVGGIFGEITPPPRGNANITLTNVTNTEAGIITGGAESGGIIGWARPANMRIINAVNRGNIIRSGGDGAASATRVRPTDVGGIVGRVGGAGFRLEGAWNSGHVNGTNAAGTVLANDSTVLAGNNVGGIIGRSTGARLHVTGAYNEGNVRGQLNAGGVIGFADANDSIVNSAVNRGSVTATRNGGEATAGGVIGRSSRRNMVVQNTGNFGTIRMRGSNNNSDGVAGVIGRSHGANSRVEASFNQGIVSGRNSAGGIVGRNQGNLNITDVYNIGQVIGGTQASLRAGNGILGRRRTGTVRITRAWVSARVGGYAVATSHSNAAEQPIAAAITGVTFSGVFVDSSVFDSAGTGITAANPANQVNRNGISLVDTEMLTSGFLPGFTGGPWRIGIEGVDTDEQRTYPYFAWQTEGGLQQKFFGFIRALEDGAIEDGAVPRYLPVMDSIRNLNSTTVRFSFGDCSDFVDCGFDCTEHNLFNTEGTRVFNAYVAAAANAVSPFASVPVPAPSNFSHEVNRSGRISIGLISNDGVVGFETKEINGRITIRGYDPLVEGDSRHYIDHTAFTIVSNDAADINLNRDFYGCLFDDCENDPDCNKYSNCWGDTMRGVGIIRFATNDYGEIVSGLNPKSGAGLGNNASQLVPGDLENFTVIRITALGYAPVYRVIHNGDLNNFFRADISIPMERVSFPIRVWVPQTPVIEAVESDNPEGPPGTAGSVAPPINARPGFPTLPGHTPGSFLAMNPVLTHSHNGVASNLTNTFETGADEYPRGHFDMQTVMWGDSLSATAPQHTENTLSTLQFSNLINRNAGSFESLALGVYEPILDLDLYITNTGLDLMHFRFVEITSINEDGIPTFRNLSINGGGHTVTNPMPNIELIIHDEPDHTKTRMETPSTVHAPTYASVTTGNNPATDIEQHAALETMAGSFQHIRIEGLSEGTIFSVVDAAGRFAPAPNLDLSYFFDWFYPLVNVDEAREASYGHLLTFANTLNSLAGRNARIAQIEEAVDSGVRGEPYLIRTVVIPLVRLREVEARVVQKIGDDYFPIYHSMLFNNGNEADGENGVFTVRDDEFNYLEAYAAGFIPQSRNYPSSVIQEILDENGHITFVLERMPVNHEDSNRAGYLEGFVWDRSNGKPIEDANIFVINDIGETIFSRISATDETGFYSIRISDIPGFEDNIDFSDVSPLRVMASYPGFAPGWSIQNPVIVTEDGAIADVWLRPNEDDYLLMVTVICDVTGEVVSNISVSISKSDDETPLNFGTAYWTLRDSSSMTGNVVIDYNDPNYTFIPDDAIIQANYIGRVATFVIRRVKFASLSGVIYRYGTADPRNVLSNVTVGLYDEDGNPVLDSEGEPITAITDSNGVYKFSLLPAGVYTLRILDVEDYAEYISEDPIELDWGDDIDDHDIPLKPILTVTFDAYEREPDEHDEYRFEPQDVVYGENATRPAPDPSRKGFTFIGWFESDYDEDEFDFSEEITSDITLYARWERIVVEITFTVGVGGVGAGDYYTARIYYGELFPSVPSALNLTPAVGWKNGAWSPDLPIGTVVTDKMDGEEFVFEFEYDLAEITFTIGTGGVDAGEYRTVEVQVGEAFPSVPSDLSLLPVVGWKNGAWSPALPTGAVTAAMDGMEYVFEFEDDLVEITFTIGTGGVDAGLYREVEVRVGEAFPSVPSDLSQLPAIGWKNGAWSPVLPTGNVTGAMDGMEFILEFEDDLIEITFTIGTGGIDAGEYRMVEVRVGEAFPSVPGDLSLLPEIGWKNGAWSPVLPTGTVTGEMDGKGFVFEFEDDLVEITFSIGTGGVAEGQYRTVEVRIGGTFPLVPSDLSQLPATGWTGGTWTPALPVGATLTAAMDGDEYTLVFEIVDWLVTFTVNDSYGGQLLGGQSSVEVPHNGNIPANAIPIPVEAPEWTFVGWTPHTPTYSTVIDRDITFTANFKQNSETGLMVTFYANGGHPTPSGQIRRPDRLVIPVPAPNRLGYLFSHWAYENENGTVWNFAADTVKGDMTLVAVWTLAPDEVVETFTVTFDANGGFQAPESQIRRQGRLVIKVPAPIRHNYRFNNWAYEHENGSVWNFASDTVENDMTLVAVWTLAPDEVVETFTVTFDANGGFQAPASQTIRQDRLVILVPAPIRHNYIFSHWAYGHENGAKWNFATDTVQDDMTLVAVWTYIGD